jgi:uncharacterized damage-inducible protein DinB
LEASILSERKKFDELALLRGWMNWSSVSRRDYLEAILRLSPEDRKKDRGASWGSIQNIFLHIIEDYFWWSEIVLQERPADQYPDLVGHEIDEKELRRVSQLVDDSVSKFMESLTPEDLGRPYVVHGVSGDGKEYTMTTCPADIVWHMVEEQLQHVGELNALFWQMDTDPHAHSWFSSESAWTH